MTPTMLDRREIKRLVDLRLAEARAVMPARVRAAFDALLRERQLRAPDAAPYFAVVGHPLFELPVWVASRLQEDGAETPGPLLADVLGVSALGYLHTRAQDDWLDGPTREDATLVALAEALIALCNRLLASAVGPSARFWSLYDVVMTGYAEALLHADELRRADATVTRSAFEQLLAQSRPLVLPSAALLDRAGRWELLPAVEEFVFTATAASQLFNDLTDLYRDRKMGQRTWTLESLEGPAAERLWADVLGASSGEGAGRLQERIGEALSFHDRSARAARAAGLMAAESWLTDRGTALAGLAGSLRGNLLTAFLRRLDEPGLERPPEPL